MTKINEALHYFNWTRSEMLGFVPRQARSVLDIGCGTGQFAKAVADVAGAEVWGVELNADAAKQAATQLHKVLSGSIESQLPLLPDNYFDCICMNDVIEHLVDPWTVLRAVAVKLKSDGVLVASIPNVRHYKNLSGVLFDADWRYTESGLLDKTHLRFFTPKSMQRLFNETGYRVVQCRGLKPSRKFKLKVLNWLSLGKFSDISSLQFAIVAQPILANA